MYYNSPLASTVIDTFLQSVKKERIAVTPLISGAGKIEAKGTFIGAVFIGKRSGIVLTTIFPMGYNRREK